MKCDSKILIAGAGPAGLACALELLRLGHAPRLVERAAQGSARGLRRGLTLRARTLSMLENLEIAADLIAAGETLSALRVEEGGRVLARFDFAAAGGAYPFLLCVPEDAVIALFSARLAALGGGVEYGLALQNLRLDTDGRAVVSLSDGSTEIYDHVIGADGANSTVRMALGLSFTGYDYPGGWYFSDTASGAASDAASGAACEVGVLNLLPGGGMRFALPCGSGKARHISNIPFEGAQALAVSVRSVNKGSARGRVTLLGSACAAHGPFGGVGMSGAIEDALALAHKISGPEVVVGDDDPGALLEHSEMVFRAGRITGRMGKFLRAYILFLCARVPGFRRRVMRALSGGS